MADNFDQHISSIQQTVGELHGKRARSLDSMLSDAKDLEPEVKSPKTQQLHTELDALDLVNRAKAYHDFSRNIIYVWKDRQYLNTCDGLLCSREVA